MKQLNRKLDGYNVNEEALYLATEEQVDDTWDTVWDSLSDPMWIKLRAQAYTKVRGELNETVAE